LKLKILKVAIKIPVIFLFKNSSYYRLKAPAGACTTIIEHYFVRSNESTV
jgi:hypothetical protein